MATDLTPEQRAELRRLEAEATSPPWRAVTGWGRVDGPFDPAILRVPAGSSGVDEDDIPLIAAARNALVSLLDAADERDALRARLAEVEKDRDALLWGRTRKGNTAPSSPAADAPAHDDVGANLYRRTNVNDFTVKHDDPAIVPTIWAWITERIRLGADLHDDDIVKATFLAKQIEESTTLSTEAP